ncbi:hypothetical protein C8J57DRAFT_1536465 [Mycena rebaudengoi]|nr:hypothetical protein C8J57DRAFT_1536465 [Mycena rebaudengoi]
MDPLGIACVACFDVLGGFCLDFTSLRHSFTQHLCSCSCCRCCGGSEAEDDDYNDPGEREPLIREPPQVVAAGAGMPPQPPMDVKKKP